MNKIIYVMIIWASLTASTHAGDYKCSVVGNASGYGLVIAKGRNDGINRLYATGGVPAEFTWNGSGWNRVLFSSTIASAYSIAAGDGRNDGVIRIYTGGGSSRLREWSFNGSTWDSILIDDRTGSDIRSVCLGDIKNDDSIRVVAGGNDSTTIAYTYQNGSGTWKKDTVGIKRGIVQDIVIGNGRNDDTNRVYSSGDIFWVEYTYRSKWDTTYHSQMIPTTGSLLSPVKNDGLIQLYISEDGGIRDLLWSGAQWLNVDSAAYGRYPFSGDGRNDGKQRLYGLSSSMVVNDSIYSDIRVLEWSYVDSIWVKNVLDTIALNYGVNFDMAAGVVGDARNDGKNRVYALSELGVIYEWEWDDSLNGVAAEPVTSDRVFSLQLNQNYPNPFNQSTVISYQATVDGPVKLAVYNIAGQLVKTLINDPSPNALGEGGVGSITWDGRDYQGKPVTNGLYFYCLEAGGTRRTKKMILLK
ncbi:MAG: hypothetical protein A2509_09545 [Candidatus Edwardsbacteria bacterium RIFOXYD12_FULL_50_11]|nr:MAG: hypothetical protein A2502_08325 [Candidatus Edwardsbacteria bacterium RifOxyC12_full_54_24]OGF07404.1 MAG: hypothetical protein A2273_02730 [Candidatus Edwardsbacteria bacterium RifOxyA12_full_54_48]OGF09656.1 MAG: hypothetical protein A3K15_09140 [Candidatus Edwardsbacteria bacterium GWE2_54_12]OGF18099.1 MAG: hypothetical protein A2509_09545 [Candidatus Edwardsbacteria bacterium RIFOXYD12_FULL_50_11]OGJ19657.1 MAG: hypothetical protein A2349_10660 [Candidatus Edwardsbacteria bacteriu